MFVNLTSCDTSKDRTHRISNKSTVEEKFKKIKAGEERLLYSSEEAEDENGLMSRWEESDDNIVKHCRAGTEKDGDPGTPGKEIWRKKCGHTAGEVWRRQHKIELDGVEWSLWPCPLGAGLKKPRVFFIKSFFRFLVLMYEDWTQNYDREIH